jgi:hypothetical protein
VRATEVQDEINPMLNYHGVKSEAREYSGRATGAAWQRPFAKNDRSDTTLTLRSSKRTTTNLRLMLQLDSIWNPFGSHESKQQSHLD